MIGDAVLITCRTEAYPNPTCEVYHNGSHLGSSGYVISSVTLSDFGTYECSCINQYGRGNGTATLTRYGMYKFIVTTFKRFLSLIINFLMLDGVET